MHVGCAGGIGTPEATAAAFLLGAEFVLTGSVKQCTVEAATSAEVKELLVRAGECDVESAQWEMFELGVWARYVKRGLFFPTRANRLHELWRRQASLDELDEAVRSQILDSLLGGEAPAGADAKARLVSVPRGYFDRGFRLAVTGAFNQVVADTDLQPWQERTVEAVAGSVVDNGRSPPRS
ncbi:hypothetical protein [Streptomyces sp. ME18-1-4]|uniref:hypothetical protein n=1 Tax=Streptomyces sp. ME18-1-4 TaxID=3028685 RepID=UPI0029A725E7|nr:hypothetical protein [Streptomyces sp. ME18-1-4]MDX3242199.1 hypothetical protein [Streptomyces sp. ME18-1-4]